MTLFISFYALLTIFGFFVAIYILFKYAKFPFTADECSAPVAIGRALAYLFLGQVISVYVMFVFYSDFVRWFGSGIVEIILNGGCVLIFYYVFFSAGILATKTVEDTKSMNYKTIIVLGFIPHFVITFISFPENLWWVLSFWPYFFFVVAGGLTQINCPQLTSYFKENRRLTFKNTDNN